MKIYVASSWRCYAQPGVVRALREAGFEVYDFKQPDEEDRGFSWAEIDSAWICWSIPEYLHALEHPLAQRGFAHDMAALNTADAVVLVKPCGRSAHLELGFACGQGKPTAVLLAPGDEPELMYAMSDKLVATLAELVLWLSSLKPKG